MDREFSMSAVGGRRIEGIWTEQARLDQASDQSHRLLPNTTLGADDPEPADCIQGQGCKGALQIALQYCEGDAQVVGVPC